MSTTASRIIKNTGWLYAKMGITMFISLLTTRLILNGLGASDFGIFNIVGGVIAMLGFLNAALTIATQRFMNYAEGEGNYEKKYSIFNVSIVLHLIIAVFIGFILLVCGLNFFDIIVNIPEDRYSAAKVVYGCLIFSTMFSIMTVPYDAVLNAHENMQYYAYIGILESVLKLLVAYICIITSKDKLIVYGVLMAIIPILTLSIKRIYCYIHYVECHISLKKYFKIDIAKEMLGFAGWTFITTMTSMVTQYGMGLVINHYFGVLINAAHGIATQLTGMLMAFTSNAQKAFNPILTKSEGAKDREKLIYISLFGCRISYFIFGLFSIPVILQMPTLLSFWLKDVPNWAIIFCRLSLLRILVEQMIISLTSAINAEGNIKNYSIARSFTYIITIPCISIMFSLGYPPYFLYIVWIICWSILGSIVTIYYGYKSVGIKVAFFCKSVFFPCTFLSILSIVPFVIGRIISYNYKLSLFLTIIQVLIFFFIGILIVLNNKERSMIKSMIIQKLKRK